MDAILRPEPTPQPDPVEEELKAPMTPAAPAPGSIGSAVSGPADVMNDMADEGPIPSVSFNDPATQPDGQISSQPNAMDGGKKNSKTLVILVVIAAMVVVALVGVLIMSILNTPTEPAPSGSNTPNNAVVVDDDDDDNTASNSSTTTDTDKTLSCTRNLTKEELAEQNDAASGTLSISVEFVSNKLSKVALTKDVVTSDEDAIDNEPVDLKVEEATADQLTAANALNYYLPIKDDGTIDMTFSGIKAHYESLDFTCDAL